MTQPVRFLGIHNGRPSFDLGDGVAPEWLLDALDKRLLVVENGELLALGSPVAVGDEVQVTVRSV